MSHFHTYIVVPKKVFNEGEGEIHKYIERVMAGYFEGLTVAEYDQKCNCIGWEARTKCNDQVNKEMGTLEQSRNKFKQDNLKLCYAIEEYEKDLKMNGELANLQELANKKWDEEYIKPRDKRLGELYSKHPLKDLPDKKCSICKGKGTFKSNYNPRSKYDWYRIGGRWDGEIIDNPRHSEDGFNFDEEHESIENNSIMIKNLKKGKYAFSFVDSKGRWHEKGNMGWFGVSTNNKSDWKDIFKELLKKEKPEDYLVCCDCHI